MTQLPRPDSGGRLCCRISGDDHGAGGAIVNLASASNTAS